MQRGRLFYSSEPREGRGEGVRWGESEGSGGGMQGKEGEEGGRQGEEETLPALAPALHL